MSRDFFNLRAATWDEKAAEMDTARLEAMAGRMDIAPGAAVLDVGTGTGVFVPYILKKIGPKGRLVCLDFAGAMLREARAKGFAGNIKFVCAAIEASGLAGESFDAAICYSVFPHFTDKPKALAEIHRLLRKGGRLFIGHTSGRREINDIHARIPEVHDHHLPGEGEMRQLLAAANFGEINISDGRDSYLASARKAV